MELIKAVPLGGVLTWVVSVVIGSNGSQGGQLAIHAIEIGGHQVYWSWPLFLFGTGLAWGLMLIQR